MEGGGYRKERGKGKEGIERKGKEVEGEVEGMGRKGRWKGKEEQGRSGEVILRVNTVDWWLVNG